MIPSIWIFGYAVFAWTFLVLWLLWRFRDRIRAVFSRVSNKLKAFDWRDLMLVIGAGLVFHGVYMLKPALAYIVLGCALVWFALFSDRRRK